jgi:3'-5' exoribonuclease
MYFQKEKDIKDTFNFFVGEVKCPKLKKVCKELYNYENFWTHIASLEHHHSFPKGLIVHTLEVTSNALHISQLYPNCDKDILITSALWHDLAKIWDYEEDSMFVDVKLVEKVFLKTTYRSRVHHVTGSTCEFTAIATKIGVKREIIQKIQHCIVSHHGNKEWGSICHPTSLEAIILHQSDMLSAMIPFHTREINK